MMTHPSISSDSVRSRMPALAVGCAVASLTLTGLALVNRTNVASGGGSGAPALLHPDPQTPYRRDCGHVVFVISSAARTGEGSCPGTTPARV